MAQEDCKASRNSCGSCGQVYILCVYGLSTLRAGVKDEWGVGMVQVGGMVIRVGRVRCISEWDPSGHEARARVGVNVCKRIWSA